MIKIIKEELSESEFFNFADDVQEEVDKLTIKDYTDEHIYTISKEGRDYYPGYGGFYGDTYYVIDDIEPDDDVEEWCLNKVIPIIKNKYPELSDEDINELKGNINIPFTDQEADEYALEKYSEKIKDIEY